MLCDLNCSVYMFNLPCLFAYVLQSDRFGPSIYNTINFLLKRMAGHPTDIKSKAHNSFCQKQLHYRLCVNESRAYSAVRLFLILCEMQTVPYCIYIECRSTNESKPSELCKTMQWLLQSWRCGTSR